MHLVERASLQSFLFFFSCELFVLSFLILYLGWSYSFVVVCHIYCLCCILKQQTSLTSCMSVFCYAIWLFLIFYFLFYIFVSSAPFFEMIRLDCFYFLFVFYLVIEVMDLKYI